MGKRRAEEELPREPGARAGPAAAEQPASGRVGVWGKAGGAAGGGENGEVDGRRAAACLQHVRALNTQFASWVQRQVRDHPDELWRDGAEDYGKHAAKILADFRDVVAWLSLPANGTSPPPPSANASVGLFSSSLDPPAAFGEQATEPGSAGPAPAGSFWSLSKSLEPPASGPSALSFSTTPSLFATPATPASGSGAALGILGQLATASAPQSSKPQLLGGGLFSARPTSAGAAPSASGLFGMPAGTSPPSPTFGGGGGAASPWAALTASQPTLFTMPPAIVASETAKPAVQIEEVEAGPEDADDEEPERPSSPSLKAGAEPGVTMLYEVKNCRLYQKGPSGQWVPLESGAVHLKRYPPPEKAPRIMFRTEVGRLRMNANLYVGLRPTLKQTRVMLALYSAHDDRPDPVPSKGGADGAQAAPAKVAEEGGDAPRLQYFALRVPSDDAAKALYDAILEHTPKA